MTLSFHATDIKRKHFTESPNGRGTLDILRSCLFTIFICCWTVVHPDIPRPGSPWRRTFLDRVICLLLAALAPEVVVYAAYYQRIQAQASFNKISKPSRPGWTMCHSFYADMGGFGLRQSPVVDLIRKGHDNIKYVDGKNIENIILARGLSLRDLPTEREVSDKGKADAVLKTVAALQAVWMVIHCAARAIQSLPITPLELSTVAYVPCSIFVTYLWWHKPYDVREPTWLIIPPTHYPRIEEPHPDYLRRTYSLLPMYRYPETLPLYRTYPMAATCLEALKSTLGPSYGWHILSTLVFLCFGSVHCLAWRFSFPSIEEELAWRASSVAIAVILPLSWTFSYLIMWFLAPERYKFWETYASFKEIRWEGDKYRWIGYISHGSALALYIVARVYLLVEVFISLRSLPAGCYDTINWLSFLPHV
jgi:hypothetical protein